jgi:hypothetical protein
MTSKLLAPVRGWEARRALRAARRRADDEILSTRLAPPRLAWRVGELLDESNRIDLGCSLTSVVHASDERLLPSASPIDRVAVRACRAELLSLAAELCDLSRTVTPRGVLLTEKLLVDGTGPLYGHDDPNVLAQEIGRVRAALNGAH